MSASVFPQLMSTDWKWKRQSQESEAREEICNVSIWASHLRNLAGGLTSEMFSFGSLKAIRPIWLICTHTHTHTHLHDCWAHECLPEKLPRNMQWLCTSPARCKWLQVLFCISSSLMEKQQKKEDGWTADKITYAGGPLYSFGVRKFFNKEGGNCQQKRKSVQNRCRSNLERSTMWHRWPRAR